MSTRGKTFALEITARARRIGWPVRQAKSGEYRITCPDKSVVQVHLTPSDVNADKAVLKQLNAHGFEEAEAKHLEQRKKERQAKLVEGRRKAEEEAKRLASQSVAVAKATGGIAMEDDEWFLMPHEVMKVRRTMVTPELARKLLALNPTGLSEEEEVEYRRNRKITRSQVDKWKKVLAAGRWQLTHEGIALSNTLKLLDGQHRLTAIAESETGAEFIIFVGLDEATFKVIGQGKMRTSADALSTAGMGDTNKLSAAARLVYLYLSPDRESWRRTPITNDEIVEMVQQYGDDLVVSAKFATDLLKSFKLVHSATTAAHFLLRHKHGGKNPHVDRFFEGLMKHRRLSDDMDPRVKLYDYITNSRERRKRIDNMDQLALIIMTWNLIADDRQVKALRWTPKTMSIPDIAVVPVESAPPRALAVQDE